MGASDVVALLKASLAEEQWAETEAPENCCRTYKTCTNGGLVEYSFDRVGFADSLRRRRRLLLRGTSGRRGHWRAPPLSADCLVVHRQSAGLAGCNPGETSAHPLACLRTIRKSRRQANILGEGNPASPWRAAQARTETQYEAGINPEGIGSAGHADGGFRKRRSVTWANQARACPPKSKFSVSSEIQSRMKT